jgi:predicted transcriptional regulator
MGKMEKIRVKLNIGDVSVEIECEPDQLESTIRTLMKTIEEIKPKKEEETGFYALTCKEAVEGLWKEGWFERPRKLGEIWDELSRRGYNYDRSAISHALLSLVREGKLSRLGKARRYQYIQKVPYQLKT